VVAGLTNQPSASGPRRDPSKRSRGELPLMFAAGLWSSGFSA
jgi:hypothetical protein